jgi:N-methylhydantoinase B
MTPGGGGYGPARERDSALIARDVRRGYYAPDEAARLFGVGVPAKDQP